MLIDRMRKPYHRRVERTLKQFHAQSSRPVRIVLYPGEVYAFDGDRHFISARRLAQLYGVPRADCIVVRNDQSRYGYQFDDPEIDFIHLGPDPSGRYELPEKARRWLSERN